MANLADVFPSLVLRSALPGGGCPSLDRSYIAWRDALVAEANDRVCDRHPWPCDPIAVIGIINGYDLDRAIFAATSGPALFEDRWNYCHRLRHLSNCLRDHPGAVERIARECIDRVTANYEGE